MHARRLPLAALAALVALGAGCMNEVESRPPQQRPAVLQLSPATVTFQALPGGPSPAPQAIAVTNAGFLPLAAPTVSSVAYLTGTAGWLQAVASGTAVPYSIALTATSTGLAAGVYTAEVTVTSPGASNSPRKVPVTLSVLTPARLVLSRSVVAIAQPVGTAAPAAETVQVTNGGQQPLAPPVPLVTYGGGQPGGWLGVVVTGASPPYTVTLQATAGTLPAGTYQALVELSSAGAENSPVAVAVDFTVPRLVTVTRTLTHWGEAGTPPATAADPDVTAVELLQDDGAGKTLRVTAAAGTPAGTWRARLPAGRPYWILATRAGAAGGLLYVKTSADTVDLGADLAGRAGRAVSTTQTDVTLDLLALDAWSTLDDTLRLTSWGAQTGFGFTSNLQAPLVPLLLFDNDADLFGYVFDWNATLRTLLAAEDVLWLQQFRLRLNTAGTLFYEDTRTWSQATGVALEDGIAGTITAADAQFFTGAGQLPLDWRRSEFEAGLPAVTTTSQTAHRVAVAGVPATLTGPVPLGGVGVPLLEASLGTTTAQDPDFPAGTLTYGRFLPAGWSELFSAGLAVDVTRTVAGATTPVPGLQDTVYRFDAAASSPRPVAPLVGAPTAPTIDGLDARSPRTGLTTTPTLGWTAPAVGAPTSYRVAIHELVRNGTTSEIVPVASFVVDGTETSLPLPVNVLLAGKTYLAELSARATAADVGGATPFRTVVPFGEGVLWTAAFTTTPP